jgi:hypothetical protein
MVALRGTVDAVRAVRQRLRTAASGSGLLSMSAGEPVLTPAEQVRLDLASVDEFLAWIAAYCTEKEEDERDTIAQGTAKRLRELVPAETVNVLNYAARVGAILWSDDLQLTQVARESGSRRVWTQRVIEEALARGWCAPAVVSETAARLSGLGAWFTRVTDETFMTAFRMTSGDPDRPPLRQVICSLGDSGVLGDGVARVALAALVRLRSSEVSQVAATEVSTHLLRAIGRRDDGRSVLRAVDVGADAAFGLDSAGASALRAQMRYMGLR